MALLQQHQEVGALVSVRWLYSTALPNPTGQEHGCMIGWRVAYSLDASAAGTLLRTICFEDASSSALWLRLLDCLPESLLHSCREHSALSSNTAPRCINARVLTLLAFPQLCANAHRGHR